MNRLFVALLIWLTAWPSLAAPSLTEKFLKRIRVGHQAGILKVYAPDLKTVRFIKTSDEAEPGVEGIDGVRWAPWRASDREQLLVALDIAPGEAEAVANKLMQNYARLPHLETVALLGALGIRLSPATTQKLIAFLKARLVAKETIQVKRQAVLALAVIPAVDFAEVAAVISFMKASRNGWETFTTHQFFDYHKGAILGFERLPEVKQRLTQSGSPRAEGILQSLELPLIPATPSP